MDTKILEASDLDEAAKLLESGELVVFPTETVYGLGADARSEEAVKKIFEAKERPADNPLIVHIADPKDIDTIASEVPKAAALLFKAFSPGPLTLVLPKKEIICDASTASLKTVGIRCPESELARELLNRAGIPVAAPSANRSGRPSPTSFSMANKEMYGRVAAIVKGPKAVKGLESTVVAVEEGQVKILRPGSITSNEIKEVLQKAGLDIPVIKPEEATEDLAKSPGTKHPHYKPKVPLELFTTIDDIKGLFDKITSQEKEIRYLVIALGDLSDDIRDEFLRLQSEHKLEGRPFFHWMEDENEYSQNLYQELVNSEGLGIDMLICQLPEDSDASEALRDRLLRAAQKI